MNREKKILKVFLLVLIFGAMLIISNNKVFAESKKQINDLDITADLSIHTYNGGERKAYVKICDGDKRLKENKDYTITYNTNCINPGKVNFTIKGIGKYKGSVNKSYYIAPQRAKITSVIFNKDYTKATVTWEKISNASGYRVYMSESENGEYTRVKTIQNNSETSYTKKKLDPNKTYYFKVRAYIEYDNKRICKKYSYAKTNTAKSIYSLNVNVDTSIHTYNGGERKAYVEIYDGSEKLRKGKDYILTYENDVEPGKATVTIKGVVNYKDTITKKYYIAPEKAYITEVNFNNKFTKATICWNAIWNASGYRIYMSESKDGEYVRIKTIDNNWTTSYTKGGLDPNKLYWFKVRAYKEYEDKKICKKYSNPKSSSGLVATVTLTSPTSGANRNHNLWLACNKLNGKIIYPGETFNWFRDHGPASAANGYRQAIVYQGTQSVLGYGGGVCQVSTTIYQASKKAGLEEVERHLHNKPVSYTDWGKDATVSYGAQNLIMRNNKGYKIRLETYAQGGTTTCKIYRVL